MLILGLDLATRTGWCLGPIGASPPAFGTHRLPSTGDDIGRFLAAYEDWLIAKVNADQPARVFFEAPILSQRTQTARKLMSLAGVTEMVCHRLGIPVQEVNISSAKKFFTDDGRADKPKMVGAARSRGWEVEDDNQADACAIWLYGCASLDPAIREQGWRTDAARRKRVS